MFMLFAVNYKNSVGYSREQFQADRSRVVATDSGVGRSAIPVYFIGLARCSRLFMYLAGRQRRLLTDRYARINY